MSERKYLNLRQLRIWNDNPRYGKLSDSDSVMDEKDAINLLIDVVGEKKMLNLVEDIIDSRGLNGNVIPTVVEKDNLFYVYDGNRRISSIKMVKRPSLIDSKYSLLIKGINEKIKNLDLSFLDKIFVYITSEEEALSLMDKTHNGEQDGVGVISWDAFNRDVSLARRGKTLKYPISFKIATVMNWTKKKDFSKISYTDFQRLFSSKSLLHAFGIKEINKENIKQLNIAISALLAYKQERGFNSFSRQFNITETGDGSDSDKPINIFINWWNEKQKAESLYLINIDAQTVFTDEEFSFDYSKVHIVNRKDGKEILDLNKEELEIHFFDPAGKRKKEINPKIGGMWSVKVFYKGVVGIGSIISKTVLENPIVVFDDALLRIRKGESLNLNSIIKYARSVHEKNMPLVDVVFVGEGEPIISGHVFSSDNNVGEYIFSFKFDNDGEEYSITKKIIVLPNTRPAINKAIEVPFSFVGNNSLTFSADAVKLIEEINNLWLTSQYYHVICCSARAVVEIGLEYIESVDSRVFVSPKKLNDRIRELAVYLLANNNKVNDICTKMRLKYTHVQNQLVQLQNNADDIASALHLGAHRSAAVLDKENLYNKMHVYVCLIVQLAEGFKLL